MKHLIALCFWIAAAAFSVNAQVVTPDKFLGYPLGSHFTPHARVAAYFRQIADAAPTKVKLINYGETNEGRPLLIAIVSSEGNVNRLEEIRTNNLKLADANGANVNLASQPAIVWLSYNVHGNEASSTETAMKTLYELCSGNNVEANGWLKNTVVIIDPCLNPDGRDRYVNFFNSVVGETPDANPMSREHLEPWPGGRPNHYYFDLNRDWAWQTQKESKARLAIYHQWMPQIHVDYHEQGYNQPYYFAPAAEPVHRDITDFQKKFQGVVGRNNAKYFDQHGWKYFTKEEFDLLYPSYGDTYPLYNGAIGMTYEQGGIRAGLAIVTNDGDTLTLADRISHHFATGMSTVEIGSKHSAELLEAFKAYFQKNVTNPPGIYTSYIVKADNISRLQKMAELLNKNRIKFAFGGNQTAKGYNYSKQRDENFSIERNDLIVNLHQPSAVLADVLLEPKTFVSDSNTYDITAWSLPYVYGLNAYASKENLKGSFPALDLGSDATIKLEANQSPLAWAFGWGGTEDAKLLIALQNANIRVRQADAPFSIDKNNYPAGTLLVMRAENERLNKNLVQIITKIVSTQQVPFKTINTGFVDKGKDFGSNGYPLLTSPKTAVVFGDDVSSLGFGEVLFYLEHDLKLHPMVISVQNINALDNDKVNTLILPNGDYKEHIKDGLAAWIKKGGRLILIEEAITGFIGKKDFEIKKMDTTTTKANKEPYGSFANKDKANFEHAIPGAIYKINLDDTHPLSYGIGNAYYGLKTDDLVYKPFEKGWNIGQLNAKSLMAGVVGKTVRKSLSTGLLIGSQDLGRGQVVYLATDPLFRNFWEVGKTLFTNVLFCTY
ncbi:hypothetical protein ACVWYG_003224 [Pedobacter sp. UYEF25]